MWFGEAIGKNPEHAPAIANRANCIHIRAGTPDLRACCLLV